MKRRVCAIGTVLLATLAGACSDGARPAALERGQFCSTCRMVILDPKFAAQIVAPGEEPRFFDDIGCLATAMTRVPPGAVAYVVDHRSGDWVLAQSAVYTRVPALETPMGSHLIAHADDASRDLDRTADGGTRLTASEALAKTGGGDD